MIHPSFDATVGVRSRLEFLHPGLTQLRRAISVEMPTKTAGSREHPEHGNQGSSAPEQYKADLYCCCCKEVLLNASRMKPKREESKREASSRERGPIKISLNLSI